MMAYNEYRYTPGIRQRGDMTWAPVIIAPAEPPPMTEKARPRPIHVTPRTPARLLHLTPRPLSAAGGDAWKAASRTTRDRDGRSAATW